VTSNDRKTRRHPALRLIEKTPAEPRWSGRRSVLASVGLGAVLWVIVAGAAWLAARALG